MILMNGVYEIKQRKLLDENSYQHTTTDELGRGGQGIVYRTIDDGFAVKLILENGNELTDPIKIKQKINEIKNIQLLPVQQINIALPLVSLQDQAGYVMSLMADMQPFAKFIYQEQSQQDILKIQKLDWIDTQWPEMLKNELAFFSHSGGHKRRLMALYRCALILNQLHGRGLVYGDINPNNEFISASEDYDEVWLIDADNIRFDLVSNKNPIFFPEYGAPELVTDQTANSIYSDRYSFAILAHMMLALHHPFKGKAFYEDGEDDDWNNDGDELTSQQKIDRGLLSWIYDTQDLSNSYENSLAALIKEDNFLFPLFQKCFSIGRKDIHQRPTLQHWAIALIRSHDQLLTCPVCKFAFSPIENLTCPDCKEKKPDYFQLDSYSIYQDDQTKKMVWSAYLEIKNQNHIVIPQRVLGQVSSIQGAKALFSIYLSEHTILIQQESDDYQISYINHHNKMNLTKMNYRLELSTENMNEAHYFLIEPNNQCDSSCVLKIVKNGCI